jgi:UDP-2,3-diacylglucosamine pyrophosphatase LpxH
MLVIISDLHLIDGTAGNHNVKGEAFEVWMDDILSLARSKHATELIFLYLGDMFDLIRTEQWFDVPLEDRPWGSASIVSDPQAITDSCRLQTRKIVQDIARAAPEALDVLSGRAPRVRERIDALGIDVRRIFIPGNHDRLYRIDPVVKADIDALLGIDPRGMEGLSGHMLESRRYGVLARHGHEFDVWNFEGVRQDRFDFDPGEFLRVPIGDLIATELLTRLPGAVRARLLEVGMDEAVAQGVYHRLQDIENVRPIAAAIPWIYFETSQIRSWGPWPQKVRDQVAATVEACAATTFEAFIETPFTQAWMKEHDRWNNPLDEADKLQVIHTMFRGGIGLNTIKHFLAAIEKLGFVIDAPQRRAAPLEPQIADDRSGLHYVVYGHTHKFEQLALWNEAGQEKVYFNSGTWRLRCMKSANSRDFAQWKVMSYLIFCHDGEDPIGPGKKGLSFTTWTGTMLKQPR